MRWFVKRIPDEFWDFGTASTSRRWHYASQIGYSIGQERFARFRAPRIPPEILAGCRTPAEPHPPHSPVLAATDRAHPQVAE